MAYFPEKKLVIITTMAHGIYIWDLVKGTIENICKIYSLYL